MIHVFSSGNTEPIPVNDEERLQQIQDYLRTTNKFLLQQLIVLDGIRMFAPPERFTVAEDHLKSVVGQNAKSAHNALSNLFQDTHRIILISRLSTGEQGTLNAIGASEDPLGYVGQLSLDGTTTTIWPLDNDTQLSLEK